MSSQDPYRIPGTDPPEPTQAAEHPSVEQRSTKSLAVAGIAVLVALVAAFFSALQWKAADRQADIADRALKLAEKSAQEQASDIKRSRDAAENSATAAGRLAGSNASMAKTLREQMHLSAKQSQAELGFSAHALLLQSRPYVHIRRMDLLGELKEGSLLKGHAEMVNSGRTPGLDVHGCADIALRPNGEPMTDDFPCPAPNNPHGAGGTEISSFTLGTDAPFPIDSPGTSISPVNTLVPLLSSGALRLYFYGYVIYGDILDPKSIHRTTFCGRYNISSGSLELCEKHNHID